MRPFKIAIEVPASNATGVPLDVSSLVNGTLQVVGAFVGNLDIEISSDSVNGRYEVFQTVTKQSMVQLPIVLFVRCTMRNYVSGTPVGMVAGLEL
jgi:hypothetical protein